MILTRLDKRRPWQVPGHDGIVVEPVAIDAWTSDRRESSGWLTFRDPRPKLYTLAVVGLGL